MTRVPDSPDPREENNPDVRRSYLYTWRPLEVEWKKDTNSRETRDSARIGLRNEGTDTTTGFRGRGLPETVKKRLKVTRGDLRDKLYTDLLHLRLMEISR